MNIKTKYNVGDTIKVKKRITKYKDCPICNKTGKITIKNLIFSCPNCHGKGEICFDVKETVEVEIMRITITYGIHSSKPSIEYLYQWNEDTSTTLEEMIIE